MNNSQKKTADDLWQRINEEASSHGYMSGVDRQSERVKMTGEVFTPTELVIEMIQEILNSDPNALAPGKRVIDPACGDGQFLIPVKLYKMWHHGMSEEDALKDIYGVDIMRDNVDLCKKRLNGGNVIMGDTLNPHSSFDEQTQEERDLMIEWFASEEKGGSLSGFFG